MSSTRPTIADLARAYAVEKAREEWHGEWAAALLYRPVAILLASVLLRLRVGATVVTMTALVLALSLPALALWGGARAYLAIGLVGIAICVLDCLDGTIARATATTSRRGHYLDFLTDVVFRICLYGAVGLLAQAPPVAPRILEGRTFGLALLAALLAVAARLCRVYDEQRTGTATKGEVPRALSRIVFSVLSGADQLLSLLVVAAGAGGFLGWVIVWLLAYSTLDFGYTQFAILKRLR